MNFCYICCVPLYTMSWFFFNSSKTHTIVYYCTYIISHPPRLCSRLKKLGLPFVSVPMWRRCTLSSFNRTQSLRFVPITTSLPVYSPTTSTLNLNHPQLLLRKVSDLYSYLNGVLHNVMCSGRKYR